MKKLKFLTLIAFAVASFSLTACNTVEGAGEDIEHAGHHVQKAAQ